MVGLGEEGYLKAADKIHTEFVKLLKGFEPLSSPLPHCFLT